MADMNIAERFMPQDGHIQINHRGARVDIRVGTMPTIYGESLVMRLLEKNSRMLTPMELRLHQERSHFMPHLAQKPHDLAQTTDTTGRGHKRARYAIHQSIYAP